MNHARDREAESIELVETAIATIPDAIDEALAIPLPHPPSIGRRIVTTGIGASEGPARLLAHRLASAGVACQFLPISFVATHELGARLLVVFSQGISPNACLALLGPNETTPRWLVTSVHAHDEGARATRLAKLVARGVVPIVIPPREERGTLVRFVGPTVAAFVALRLASHLGDDAFGRDALVESARRYAIAAGQPAPALAHDRPIAIVAAGTSVEEAYAARWKLLETLLAGDPPIWDVLSFAHGPVQAMASASLTLVVLETPDGRGFVERLRQSAGEQHTVVQLLASRSDPVSTLEHAGRLDAVVLATLRATPRNLFEWPRRNDECPLYRLGEELP